MFDGKYGLPFWAKILCQVSVIGFWASLLFITDWFTNNATLYTLVGMGVCLGTLFLVHGIRWNKTIGELQHD